MTLTTTKPGEIGQLAAAAIRGALTKATGLANISTYIEATSPLPWELIADGGWDLVGVAADDDSATLRDLVEIAKVWGEISVQLPLIPSILAKRHSVNAAEHDGPVTFSIATQSLPSGTGMVPFGQIPGIAVATTVGIGDEQLSGSSALGADTFAASLLTSRVPFVSTFSADAAREICVVWAAEASGIAKRAVADAVAYAKQRTQFGKPIGSFQAVKHHLANAHLAAEQAETAAVWGSLDSKNAHRSAEHSFNQSLTAIELAIQVHGGLGFTWEMGLHFSLRHVIALRELARGLRSAH